MNRPGLLEDVLAEPAALDALAEAPPPALPDPAAVERVLLIGMGSSRYAARDAAVALRHAGRDAHAELASTGRPQPPDPGMLCVLVSAGGRSAETLAALERHRGRSGTLALTNDPASPLAAGADRTWALGAGEEAGGIATRTFHATVALLRGLVAHLTGDDAAAELGAARRAADALRALHGGRDAWLTPLADLLEGRTVRVAAPDERLACALQGALVLREGPRVEAVASETGDWSHVDVYLSRHPGYALVLLGGSAHEAELLDWLARRRRTLVTLGREVPGAAPALHVPFPDAADDAVAAHAEVSALELLAHELWRRQEETP